MAETITIRSSSATEVIKVVEAGPQGPQGPAGSGLGTLTTQGDTLYRGASDAARLPIGTPGQILKVNSGGTAPEWGEGGLPANVIVSGDRAGTLDISGANVPFGGIGGNIYAHGTYDATGGSLDMQGDQLGNGGSITTKSGGGSIDTRGTGSVQFGVSGTRTTLTGQATTDRAISLPDADGQLNSIAFVSAPNPRSSGEPGSFIYASSGHLYFCFTPTRWGRFLISTGVADVSYSVTGNATTDYLTGSTLPSTEFANGSRVQFQTISGGGGAFTTGVDYFVINRGGSGATSFQLSASSGGSAITFTSTITSATMVRNAWV